MPKLAQDYYKYGRYSNREEYSYQRQATVYTYPVREQKRMPIPPKRRKKRNPLRVLTSCLILGLLCMTFMPYSYNIITKSIFNPTPYKNLVMDLHELVYPSSNYLSNNLFMGEHSFNFEADPKHAQMLTLKESVNMPSLESEILSLMEEYPAVKPSVYVWDYETGNYIDINASAIYPAASIIKIPVLIDLFKSIEIGAIDLNEKMPLTEYYRTEGSGDLQFKAQNSMWTIDTLARIMITNSDNTATNMLITKLGGMPEVNQSIRDWGIKNTEIKSWLPDLAGSNYSTTKEIARMLYNIDSNEKFLTEASRHKIFEYMGHVHNDRLIQAGLGKGSAFYHKTGDIGTMLGDAGIVVTPKGNRYVVAIFAKRPHNSVQGKEFIVKASEIIYNYMVR